MKNYVRKFIYKNNLKIDINDHIISQAKKCYLIIQEQHKFLQGRKTRLIAGIILYTICRQNKTVHLLIDFSDVLQTNLYVLGNLYLKIIRLLNLEIPQIDPSLFIQRFCGKLNLGNKASAIATTALKILQSMKRNWLHLGRRPNGLCGAAILIAASCHEEKKTLDEVVDVVHVCNGTVKKRITEFSLTPTSGITKEDLDNTPLLDDYKFNNMMMDDKGMDPPSFIANRLKDLKMYEKEVISKTLEIEAKLNQKISKMRIKPHSQVRIVFQKTTDKIDSRRYVLSPHPFKLTSLKKNDSSVNMTLNEQSIGSKDETAVSRPRRSSRISRKNSSSLGDRESKNSGYESEILSDLDDKEVEIYCLSNEEHKLKKNLWEIMYQDWIEEQEVKKKQNEINDKTNKQKEKSNLQDLMREELFAKKKRKPNVLLNNLVQSNSSALKSDEPTLIGTVSNLNKVETRSSTHGNYLHKLFG